MGIVVVAHVRGDCLMASTHRCDDCTKERMQLFSFRGQFLCNNCLRTAAQTISQHVFDTDPVIQMAREAAWFKKQRREKQEISEQKNVENLGDFDEDYRFAIGEN